MKGTTRRVFLIGSYAIKIPRTNLWKSFLRGILANLDEHLWYIHSPDEWRQKMCPVIGVYLKGLILIMKKAQPITNEEYSNIDLDFYKPLPMDNKIHNFGSYNGRIVLVDYADSRYFCSDCENIFKHCNDKSCSLT